MKSLQLTKQNLAEILCIKKDSIRVLENRNQLENKLKEKGYVLINKIKNGRSFIYEIIELDIAEQRKDIDTTYGKRYISNFKVKSTDFNNIGVYYILKDNDIYIGSTINGFRRRFMQHYEGYDKQMKHTYELLHNNGEFHILHDMTGIEDEPLIRQTENDYINYFRNNTDYNVINHMYEASWAGKNSDKQKYKSLKGIKVKEEDYNQVRELLRNNGFINDNYSCTENKNINCNQETINFDYNNIPF